MVERIGTHVYEHHADGKFTVDGKTCYSIRFGWDEGGPESGPIFRGATDVVFADTASEAKEMWENHMGESLRSLEGWSEPYLSSREEIEQMEEDIAFFNEPLPFE